MDSSSPPSSSGGCFVLGKYLRRVPRALLGPDIIEAIARGDESSGLSLEKLTKKLPMLWDEQRQRFRLAEH